MIHEFAHVTVETTSSDKYTDPRIVIIDPRKNETAKVNVPAPTGQTGSTLTPLIPNNGVNLQ